MGCMSRSDISSVADQSHCRPRPIGTHRGLLQKIILVKTTICVIRAAQPLNYSAENSNKPKRAGW
jgi:hypothetical protein